MLPPFPLQPTLQNDRLLLRPLREEDLEALFGVASDPLIWEQHPAKERSERAGFEAFFKDSLASGGALLITDKSTGDVMGSSRYAPVPGFNNTVEIGWSYLARRYWGGAYNRQVKSLMLEYAFQFVPVVVFYVNEHNLRSQRAMEKIGGRRISEIEGAPLPSKPLSQVIFGVFRADFAPALSM